MARDSKISEINGRLYAVLNWQSRRDNEDVLVAAPLTGRQVRSYRALLRKGLTETQIFDRLFPQPEKPAGKLEVDVDMLTKKQLAELACRALGLKLPSMEKMSKKDLATLVVKLAKG